MLKNMQSTLVEMILGTYFDRVNQLKALIMYWAMFQ